MFVLLVTGNKPGNQDNDEFDVWFPDKSVSPLCKIEDREHSYIAFFKPDGATSIGYLLRDKYLDYIKESCKVLIAIHPPKELTKEDIEIAKGAAKEFFYDLSNLHLELTTYSLGQRAVDKSLNPKLREAFDSNNKEAAWKVFYDLFLIKSKTDYVHYIEELELYLRTCQILTEYDAALLDAIRNKKPDNNYGIKQDWLVPIDKLNNLEINAIREQSESLLNELESVKSQIMDYL